MGKDDDSFLPRYELNPLICLRRGSEMKLIAVITDPAEVREILRHLIKTGRAPPGLDPRLPL